MNRKHIMRVGSGAVVVALLICGGWVAYRQGLHSRRYVASTYAMSTVVTQSAYGPDAEDAMAEVEQAMRDFEAKLSLYNESSDIAAINAAAGESAVTVQDETYDLLMRAKALSAQSEGAFAITIAPLTLAWGVNTDAPHVLSQTEIDALLPLVNDDDLILQNGTACLAQAGQAIDLGGIAKGEVCRIAAQIYDARQIDNAVLSIGGNVYVRGTRPDGSAFQIGFRDPQRDAQTSIASFSLCDEVIAVSGGYERYFEANGVRYAHIFNPQTGAPAQTDIVSVGVIDADGATADFYSTTLYVWGKGRALRYFKEGGKGLLLDDQNNLYVSAGLRDSFTLLEEGYQVRFIE